MPEPLSKTSISNINAFLQNRSSQNNGTSKTYQQNFFSSLKILHHSLSTPLGNILLNLQLLAKDNNFSQHKSNNHLYLYRALISTKYLQKIMQQCNQTKLTQDQFSPKEALREVVEICIKPSVEGQLISFLKIPDKLQLLGNRLYFQEAMICLLNNAFQSYSEYDVNKLVVLTCQEQNKKMLIKITDGGSGFLQLNDSSSKKVTPKEITQLGTGIPFARKVIEQHFNGSLTIETYPKRGSTLHCSFPFSK